MSLVMEFAVNMTCQSCVNKIENQLRSTEGINNFEISLDKGMVLVETKLPSSVVKDKIESTGRTAVLNGYGSKIGGGDTLQTGLSNSGKAAVAMLGGMVGHGLGIKGVVRFVQADNDNCIIDGTIDGLHPGLHGLHIHECGDISRGCESVGDHFDLNGSKHGGPQDGINERHTGDLGNIEANTEGRAVFRLQDRLIKISDIIGRSVVVTENADDLGKGQDGNSAIDGNSGNRLACGIISRSAGLFENSKKICACDGVTIWDERNKPLAGPGRQAKSEAKAELCSAL